MFTLSLHTDRLAPKAEARLPGCNRVIYVREGDVIVRSGAQAAGLAANSAWHGVDDAALTAGNAGATLLRWELGAGVTGTPVPSLSRRPTLAQSVELNDPGGYLMRCDRVDFPPGGAWFEAGPDPVLATASKSVPTAFARVMILPRELRGKSSIRYVRPEDADKPRLQTYRVFVDAFINLPR